uniref:Uncharacterized protein n=1 Tax=Clytia hemisphaerica TaxID=252671 RepID=A0A7M5UHX4_9CNID
MPEIYHYYYYYYYYVGCKIMDGKNKYQINSMRHVTDMSEGFSARAQRYEVTYVSPRKQNILQRLWRRLKRDKLRKLAKKLTNAEETIAIDRRWYHKLIWCRGEADPDNFLIEDSFSLPADVRESESLIIADTTLFVVGKQIPTNQTNEECESLRIISSLSDSSSEENNLHTKCCSPEIDSSRLRTPAQINNSNELETVGIGSVVDFPPVENTIFAKRRPLPKIANKGPHPWSHQLTGGEKEQPAPVISKQLTSRPLPKIKDCCSNVTLDETNKSSFDSGIDEFADEVNEEIERAMRAACARNVPAKKENKKREELLLCQTPNLEKGQSGFSWQLDHKLTGPCNRASTPRPQLSSSTLRSMRRRTAVE